MRKIIKEQKIVVGKKIMSLKTSIPVFDSATRTDTRPVLLFVVTQSVWQDRQKYVVQLIQHYREKYNIHVIFGAFEFTGKNIFQTKLQELDCTIHPIKTLKQKNIITNELSTIFAIRKIVRLLSPQIVHAQDAKSTLLSGIAMVGYTDSKLITSVHSLLSFDTISGIELVVAKFFTKLSYSLASQIIVHKQYIYEQSAALWNESKTSLIFSASTPIQFINKSEKLRSIIKTAPTAIAEKLRNPKTIIIGNISPLESDQGITFLLQAIAAVSQQGYSLVYIHYGFGDQQHLLQREIIQFGITDCVLLKGPDALAATYLHMFDMFVCPTIQPGMPAIIKDVAQAELPLIITDVPGISGVLEHDVDAVIVPSHTTQPLTDAIIRVITDTTYGQSLGKQLRTKIERDYNSPHMIDQTEQVYQR